MSTYFRVATWQHKGNKKKRYSIHLLPMLPMLPMIYTTYIHTHFKDTIYDTFSIRSIFSDFRGNIGNTIKNRIASATVYVTFLCPLLPLLQKYSALLSIKNKV